MQKKNTSNTKKLDKNSKAEEVYSKNISNLDYRGNSHK